MNLKAHPDEEVDHEENVESEVDLLCGVFNPRSAGFHTIPGRLNQVKQKVKVKATDILSQ